MIKNYTFKNLAIIAIAVFANVFSAKSATYTWTGSTSASWAVPANWTPTGIPGAPDDVIINIPGANSLNILLSHTVTNFTLHGTGVLNMAGSSSLTINGNLTSGGTPTANLDCTSSFIIASAAPQTVPAYNYGNLNISGGFRTLASSTISICGNFTALPGTITATGSTVTFNGTATQTIFGANTFANLIIANSSLGGVVCNSSITVTTLFGLNIGKLFLGPNNLDIGPAPITGGSSTSYVVTNGLGQLKRAVAATATTFPVGNAAYNPITFTNIGISDVFSVSVIDANASTNAFNATKQVNRNWQVSESTAGGSILSSIVAQYNTADGAQPNFASGITPKIGVYTGSVWTDVTANAAGLNPFTYTTTSSLAGPTGTFFMVGLGKDDAFLASTYTTVVSGNWNVPATWVGGVVPPSGADVAIAAGHSVTLNTSPITVGTLTISNSASLNLGVVNNVVNINNSIVNNGTLTIGNAFVNFNNPGSNLINNGTVSQTGGEVSFLNPGTIGGTSATTLFYLVLNSGVNFANTNITISNTLQIRTGGFVAGNAPNYTNTSTLQYNAAGLYPAGLEWITNAVSGAGVPQNVVISNNTQLSFATTTNSRSMLGNLSFANGPDRLFLSTNAGGYLNIFGNILYSGGGINHILSNNNKVMFSGTAVQTFIWPTSTELSTIEVNKTGGSLTCTSTTSAFLSLTGVGSTDALTLTNGNITMGTGTSLQLLLATNKSLNIGSSGTRTLNSLQVFGPGTLTVNSGGATQINFASISTSTSIDFGNNLSTITVRLTLNTGGSVINNAPAYGASSNLTYNTGTFTRGLEWSTTSGYGYPVDVTVSSGVTVNAGVSPATAAQIAGTLNIQATAIFNLGSPSLMAASTQVRSIIIDGTLTMSTGANASFISNNGNVTIFGTLNQNGNDFIIQGTTNGEIGGANAVFNRLIFNRTGLAPIHNVDITAGYLRIGANANFTVQPGRKLIMNPPLVSDIDKMAGGSTLNTSVTGEIQFISGTVNVLSSSVIAFKKLTITNSVANFSTVSHTISDTLLMGPVSSFLGTSIAPTYNASSHLIYAGNGNLTRGKEWSSAAGAGMAANVTVRTNTNLQFATTGINENTNVRASGNFIIQGGSTVDLSISGDQFKATLFINSNLTVGNVGVGTLTLSNFGSGEEVYVQGDLAVALGSTLNCNNTKIELNSSFVQNISVFGTGEFYKLELGSSGGARLQTNITILDELVFSGIGNLDLNNFNVTLSPTAEIQGEDNNSSVVNSAILSNGLGWIGFAKVVNNPVYNDASNIGISVFGTQSNLGSITIKRYPKAIGGVGITSSINRFYEVILASPRVCTVSFSYLTSELNGNPGLEGAFQIYNSQIFNNGSSFNSVPPSTLSGNDISSQAQINFLAGPNYFTAGTTAVIPLSGTINIPSEVATLEQVIDSLNINGVIAPGLTINFAPNYIGTLGNIIIDVQNNPPSAVSPIIFQGDPNNLPTFNARPGGTIDRDGMVRIIGTSFVTIQNIIFNDPPINDDNFERMEWGIAILKKANNDASQNVTIRNCRINLQNADTASTGIYLGNHSFNPTQSFIPTNAFGNFNQIRIQTNVISRVNKGIILRGFNTINPVLLEKNIFIGDSLNPLFGNVFNNLGGNQTPTIGIHLNHAASFVIGNNTFDNIANGGVFAQGDIRGISVTGNTDGYSSISSNTLSLKQALTDKPLMVINNGLSSMGAFLRIKKNIIQNNIKNVGNTGEFFAIRNTQPEIFRLQIDSNRIINNTQINTTANVYGIYNTSETEKVYILRDTVRNFASSTTADMMVIYNPSGADSVIVVENTIVNISKTGSGGQLAVYYNDAVAGFVMMANPNGGNGGVQIQAGAGTEKIIKNYIKNVTGFGVANIRGILTTGRTTFDKIVDQNKVKTFTASGGTIKGITIVDGNVITANANTLDNYTSNASIYAIEAFNGLDVSIDNDSIFDITQTGTGSAYGIYHTTTSSGGHTKNILNNDILNISKTTGSGDVYAIAHEESGNGSTSLTTNNNVIDDITQSGSGASYGIYQSGAGSGGPHSMNFNSNSITNIDNGSSSPSYGIYQSGAGSGGPHTVSNLNNVINTLSHSSSGNVYAIYQVSSATTGSNSFTNTSNNIDDIDQSGTGASYGIYQSGAGSGGPHSINNATNTIDNITQSGSGASFGIYQSGAGSGGPYILVDNGNIINNVSNSSSSDVFGIFQSTTSTGGSQTSSRVNNSVSDVSSSGSGNAYGIYQSGAGSGGPHIGITRNNNLSEISSTSGNCFGIYQSGAGSGGPHKSRMSGNVVQSLSSTTGAINGIYIADEDSLSLSSNKIVDFTTVSGNISGLNINVSTVSPLGIISNSVIGDFVTSTSSSPNSINGIDINGSSIGNLKFYYNSVFIQASSGSGTFGTNSFVFPSTVSVDLRNNVFVNKSNSASGSGVRVLKRNGLSGGILSTSNNNAYFVSDSTVSNNFIFSDGTNNFQNFNAYRSFIGFENVSFAENVDFLSVDGSNSNFLKVNTLTETRIESGGTVSNLGVLRDAVNAFRFGAGGYAGIGTATDIGAYENNYTPVFFQWLGLVSNNWNSAGNWTGGILPNSTRDVVIKAITSPQPNLNTVDATCRNIKFIPNGAINPTVTIPSGRKLIIEGSLTGSGSFINSGLVEFNSLVAQSISGVVSAVNLDLNNSSGLTINPLGRLSVSRELGLRVGTLTTNTNNLVIAYSGSAAGYINDFSGGYSGSIAGGVKVQRFVNTPVLASHTIASPVTNGATVAGNYSDNFVVNGSPAGYVYNTDPTVTQPATFPSTWWFDETLIAPATPGWTNGVSKVMSPGIGIMATILQNRLIDVIGTANTGLYNIPVTRTDDGLNLIGNPYPSPISLNAVLTANSATILPFVYVWNRTNYAAYSSGGPGIWVNNVGAGTNDRLAHSQGFFVISSVPGITNVVMNNTMRTTNQSHVYFATPQNECRIQLKDGIESDELLIRTDGESNDEYDMLTDAKKLLNEPIYSSTLYSLSKDNYPLTINTLKDFEQDKVVAISINSKTSGNKELQFNELSSIDPSVNVYLEDASMGKFQDMRANTKYEVNLTEGNSGSRFYVHFSKKALVNTTIAENQSQFYSSQNQLFVDLANSKGNSEIRIYNSLGQLVEYKNISSNNGGKAQLNLQNLSGAYVVQLITNGEVKNEKVVFGN